LLLVAGLSAPVALLAQTQADIAYYQRDLALLTQQMQSAGSGIVVNPILRAEPGKPFSATVTESTSQTLTDGTHVVRTTTTIEYRDAEGRTRVETMHSPTGPVQRIVIRDPIAGATYNLDAATKTALQTPRIPVAPGVVYDGQTPPQATGGRGGGGGRYVASAADGTAGARGGGGAGGGGGARGGGGAGGLFTPSSRGGAQPGNDANTLVEDLGTTSVSGISARGSRVTTTVPVGAIGNDREFHSVTERWFSPELNLLIKSSSTDPRFGATMYELTNISRTPPDPSLFRLPADYSLK
jgi:LysM repeat protein